MNSRFIFILLTALFVSCKKDSATGGGPTSMKTPNFNQQELDLLGNWSIDSTSVFNSSDVYQSHTLPSSTAEPRIGFQGLYDCAGCSDVGYYRGAQGTTPGNFDPAVWSAQVKDTLRFGPARVLMTPYRILILNGTNLKLRLNTSSGYSLQYYHRVN